MVWHCGGDRLGELEGVAECTCVACHDAYVGAVTTLRLEDQIDG